MRILHTSDWHLGKTLGRFSRLHEQMRFVDELAQIVTSKSVDAVLVCGDVFDVYNPSTAAEKLFFSAVSRLSEAGAVVIVIAGNHDSPEKLTACLPLAAPRGIYIIGTVQGAADYSDSPHCIGAGEGYIKLRVGDETLCLVTLPYINESRMKQLFSDSASESDMQAGLNTLLTSTLAELSTQFTADTVNIIAGHLFVRGGMSSDSERMLIFGNALTVDADIFPPCHYIAMGHLHRAQRIPTSTEHSYYSGSPLPYSLSEATNAKCVYIADITSTGVSYLDKLYLQNTKPIASIKADTIQSAVEQMKQNPNAYIYLTLTLDRTLEPSERDELFAASDSIVDIAFTTSSITDTKEADVFVQRSIIEEFTDFYTQKKHFAPSTELCDLLLELMGGDADETAETDS